MEKLLLIVLVFSSWLIGFSTPSISESRMSKDIYSKSLNSLNKSNTTRTESSLDKISELGLVRNLKFIILKIIFHDYALNKQFGLSTKMLQLLTSCPFVLKKNEMHGRIPSMFYEVECLTCKSCSKNGSKSRCTQLVTEIEATFVSKV